MAIRVYPASASHADVAAGSDGIIAALAIPAEAQVNRIWFSCDIVGSSQSVVHAAMYGIDAYLLPVLDPDTEITPDVMWDAQVPKDDSIGSDVVDLDTLPAGADTTPRFEPGDPSISTLVGLTTAPRRLFKRRRLLTFAKRAAGFESASPDTFKPAESFSTKLKPRLRVQAPSYLLFGLSSPGTLRTGAAWFTAASAREWMQLRYLQSTVDDMYKQLVGLTEAGAETPYEDAATLLSNWLQQFVEGTATSFNPIQWTVFTEMTVELMIHGDINRKTLSAGGVT